MQKEGMRLGGEQSGHIIFLDYMPTVDGQLAALQFLDILSHSDKKPANCLPPCGSIRSCCRMSA